MCVSVNGECLVITNARRSIAGPPGVFWGYGVRLNKVPGTAGEYNAGANGIPPYKSSHDSITAFTAIARGMGLTDFVLAEAQQAVHGDDRRVMR